MTAYIGRAVSDHPRPFTIDTDRRGRGVHIALILIGIPFVVSLAGLGLRSPLSQLALLGEDILAVSAVASGAAVLLVVAGAWAVDWWTVRKQVRALAAVNRQLEVTSNEIETERARHTMELKIKTMAGENRNDYDPSHGAPGADLELRPTVLDAVAESPKLPEWTS